MPTEALWALVVSLVIYSLGVTYKFAFVSHSLKLADKEINGLVEQVARIKNHQDESVPSLVQFNNAELDKILNEYRNQINTLNNIILDMKTPTNYTAYIKEGTKPKMTLGLAKAIASGDVVLKKDT